MSKTAQKLFESLRTAADRVHGGVGHAVSQAKSELGRLGTQGTMELASALFNGHGFVPYGPGQNTPSREQQNQQAMHQNRDRGMER